MQAQIDVLLLPYDSAWGGSMLARLISELESGAWLRFRAAVAFARKSGNDQRLVTALRAFADGGGEIEMTFGADTFAGDAKGSDYDAIDHLLTILESTSVKVHLYHEPGRTFHPKIYLFDNEPNRLALLIVGSSNWSDGGFVNNIEANIAVHLDLSIDSHRAIYDRVAGCFERYWSER